MNMNTLAKIQDSDNVLQRRLYYDGSGTGQDKRLCGLMKDISEYCLLEDSNGEASKLYHSISKNITGAIYVAEKNEKISQMYDKTFENLEKAIQEKAECMEKVKNDLVNLQLELEYIEKQKKVNEYPNSVATEKTMQDVERRKQYLLLKVEKQRSRLGLLAEACKNLQKVLENDEENDDKDLNFEQ